ncbi:hypothetical protein [Eggerthella sp. YY7918]|uniref:hypothetical protein n=1 Tax=Eggerthella sp. (strain YY7918) TaxID=502558 RepID=UPI000217116B|nr:hypothetical protein [Eggerthella sp. YY7918]BAK45195.1 hypothetical protein EGYY_21050 [Eggerthella sp. YY7918]
MALAIVIGAVAGFIGFIPLFIALRMSRRSTSTSAMNAALYGLVGVFISLVVLIVEMIVCAQVARSLILPFGLAEIVALIVSTAIYVVYKNGLGTRK